MKEHKKKSLLKTFKEDELKKQETLKGGPETDRGTETVVQGA